MDFIEELKNYSYAEILENEPMKKHNSFGVGGNCRYFAKVDSLYSLRVLIDIAKKRRKKFKVIGNGSNLLFSDKGFDGIVVSLERLQDIFFARNQVKVMAGATITQMVDFCVNNKLSGIENLVGIPATLGGAIVMNAGAFGNNISDYLTTVQTLKNGKMVLYDKKDCKFGYRTSKFLNSKEVVVCANFSFVPSERNVILNSIKNNLEKRKLLQPIGRTFGSVFRNPTGQYAGSLIEKCGLKGFAIGGACISTKHANFIVNTKNATAEDVKSIIEVVKKKVLEKFNILLIEEVEYVGEF
ncbi:MAG: UDP-N-acetylmuramate dehydrogenase [Clostridia bacterium]|nr:UDP-N-acetylmuramate dehydrogenase [Clostridia bacterium]